jgi:hypothetical protein
LKEVLRLLPTEKINKIKKKLVGSASAEKKLIYNSSTPTIRVQGGQTSSSSSDLCALINLICKMKQNNGALLKHTCGIKNLISFKLDHYKE